MEQAPRRHRVRRFAQGVVRGTIADMPRRTRKVTRAEWLGPPEEVADEYSDASWGDAIRVPSGWTVEPTRPGFEVAMWDPKDEATRDQDYPAVFARLGADGKTVVYFASTSQGEHEGASTPDIDRALEWYQELVDGVRAPPKP
jgi:hypothetical protein